MPTLKQAVRRLRAQWILPPSGTVSLKDLHHQFRPIKRGSTRSLLLTMQANYVDRGGGSTHPYYRREMPEPQKLSDFAKDFTHIDLTNAHMEPNRVSNPVEEANRLFDKRAAAAVRAAVSLDQGIRIYPNVKWVPIPVPPLDGLSTVFITLPFHVDDDNGIVSDECCQGLVSNLDLLEMKFYGDEASTRYIPTAKCLPALAYLDFFPDSSGAFLSGMVSNAILAARPGWCGTVAPAGRGDYDMSQMHLLQIVYRYYDELNSDAQKHLIGRLLANGMIHRYGTSVGDIVTSGGAPNDWSRAGHIGPARVGETENHILMMHTARYLTNQLLYQRDHHPNHDNRRNGSEDSPTCTDLMLYLLRNILRDDLSEYNAKNYQTQTRYALLNLCSYAYDDDVRLAARMALDYVSAHIAVSSNDLRRMVPFRRRNEGKNVTRTDLGFMDVGLLETTIGADPMAQHFAMLAGNTRIYGRPTPYHPEWRIYTGGSDGNDAVMYALSDYRLPPCIHDLFVNDLHRRFFQRLHRTFQDDVEVTGRNADNFEIYAGSPSYLISAGGSPATYAIDPTFLGFTFGDDPGQQLGVAVTTSFMPTTRLKPDVIPLLNCGDPTSAIDLIQFGHFSDTDVTQTVDNVVYNYGVAPDFACGHQVNLPLWCRVAIAQNRDKFPDEHYGRFEFVDRGSAGDGPGFFLAFFRDGDLTVMEAFDTWLHRGVTFEVFKRSVYARNKDLMNRGLHNEVADEYRTQNGNVIRFIIQDGSNPEDRVYGAVVVSVVYSGEDSTDAIGNADRITDKFLNGTILNSTGEAKVEITNPFLGKKITLDMSDPKRPKRTSETGEVEEAGSHNEVWVDFGYFGNNGPSEGDFFRPFNSVTAAAQAVADGGVIKIVPGWTTEKPSFPRKKRIRLVAPIGGVTIGVR